MGSLRVLWCDDSGRISPLKCATLAALFAPALWTAGQFLQGDPGAARPLNEALHEIGRWASRFLLAALAVTPLRWALAWPQLLAVRRMIGVAAFIYAVIHLLLYALDQEFDLSFVAT